MVTAPVALQATPGPDYADLEWREPVDKEGDVLLFYEVSQDGGHNFVPTGELKTNHRVGGLRPGNDFRFQVRALAFRPEVPGGALTWDGQPITWDGQELTWNEEARVPFAVAGAQERSPGSNIVPLHIPLYQTQVSTSLLIGQWRNADNLKKLVDIGLAAHDRYIGDSLEFLEKQHRIETAEGVYLDYIGERLGVRREYTTEGGDDPRFGYDDAGFGFDQAPFRGDAVNDATFPLPDIVFRRLLRARAILLLGDGTFDAFERACLAIDPNCVVTDGYDMTLRVVTNVRWQFEVAERMGALPRNGGVLVEYTDFQRFGFDDAGVPFDAGPFVSEG